MARKARKQEKAGEESRRWRARHPDLAKEIQDRYQAANRDKIRAQNADSARKRRAKGPDRCRRRSLAFKARQEAHQEVVAGRKRPDLCEECGEHHLRIVFDHDHTTGAFRGWLCDRCNKTLGIVRDDPDLLERLADTSGGTAVAKLTAAARKALPKSEFAIPDRRAYPLNNASHARNALARVSQHGDSEEKAKVRRAVRRKFPGIGQHAHHAPTEA